MMLKNIKIYSTNGDLENLRILKMIRNVTFKQGLNLIIDSDGLDGQGNDIGKTTFIDLIDLCLGAKNKNAVYVDKETKLSDKANIVQSFIEDKKVVVELEILHHKIIRPLFETKPNTLVFINGEKKNLQELNDILCESLFGVSSQNISYRSLLSKFIRNDKESMDNITDFLDPHTKLEEKRSIKLFLFGYSDTKKTRLIEKLKEEIKENEKVKKHYEKDDNYNESQLNELIKLERSKSEKLKNNISELGTENAIFNLLNESRDKKNELKKLMQEYESVCFRIKQNENSIRILDAKKSTIQESTLQLIYDETKKYIPDLHKTFKDFILIHNQTIENEKKFIEETLLNLNEDKKYFENKIKDISEQTLSLELITKIQDISEELSSTNEKIGQYQERKNILENVSSKINKLNEEIEEINNQINNELNVFKENISSFNLIYSDYQELVYGKRINFISEDQRTGFELFSDKPKSGDGQKKGEVILFDLAYNKLSTDKNIKAPKFIIHDQLELTDIAPKRKIFLEILPSLDCQFIVPTIRSSIVSLGSDFIESNTILSLSKNDKIFRIEEYDEIEDYREENSIKTEE